MNVFEKGESSEKKCSSFLSPSMDSITRCTTNREKNGHSDPLLDATYSNSVIYNSTLFRIQTHRPIFHSFTVGYFELPATSSCIQRKLARTGPEGVC